MKRKLPTLQVPSIEGATGFQIPPSALDRWDNTLGLQSSDGKNVIEILDIIGEDPFFGGGVSAKSVSQQLRSMSGPVDVLLNSPGGFVTEGVSIFNMLQEYKGDVTIKIIGMAGSIASVIALAGDKIEIARTGFFMIHNSSTIMAGDKYDMKLAFDWLDMVDETMREVYALRSGLPEAEIAAMMDRETTLRGRDAVDKGFADALLGSEALARRADLNSDIKFKPAAFRADAVMARAGLSRAERRKLLSELKSGTPRAAEDVKPGADGEPDLEAVMASLRKVDIP